MLGIVGIVGAVGVVERLPRPPPLARSRQQRTGGDTRAQDPTPHLVPLRRASHETAVKEQRAHV